MTKNHSKFSNSQKIALRLISAVTAVSLVLNNSAVYASMNGSSLVIRHEILKEKGILVSRPVAIDEKIRDFLHNNQIRSLADYELWVENNFQYILKENVPKTWKGPLDILELKKGDCRDFATFNVAVLRVLGYDPRFYALVKSNNLGHAVCTFKLDGYYAYFDNEKLMKTNASTVEEFARLITESMHYSELYEMNYEKMKLYSIYKAS